MCTTFTHLCSAAIVLTMLSACGGDATSPPGPPVAIKFVGSASITGVVGDTLPAIVVEVYDANGRAVPNATVWVQGDFAPQRGGAHSLVTATSGNIQTGPDGKASVHIVAPILAGNAVVQIGIEPASATSQVELLFTTAPGPFTGFVARPMIRLAGASFTIDSLFTAVDRYGNAVTMPTAQLAATNGWVVAGGTVTPPSATYTGTALVSVTSGSVTATDTVSVVEDLRAYHWSIQQKCVFDSAAVATGMPDSTVVDGTAGRAYYPGDPGFADLPSKTGNVAQPAVEFRFSGTYTQYNHNGTVIVDRDFVASEPYGFDASAQHPDTLVFGYGSYAHATTRVAGALPRYVNPTWCNGFVLQAY